MTHAEKCPVCSGSGEYADKKCHGCKGKGWVTVSDVNDVLIKTDKEDCNCSWQYYPTEGGYRCSKCGAWVSCDQIHVC